MIIMTPDMLLIANVFALLVLTTFALENNSSCSDLGSKWQEAGGRCFYVDWTKRLRNYKEMEYFCQNIAGNIPLSSVSLVAEVVQNFVNEYLERDNGAARVWWSKPTSVIKTPKEYLYSYEDYTTDDEEICWIYDIDLQTHMTLDCLTGLELIMCESMIPKQGLKPEVEMKKNCPKDWEKFGNMCYLFSTEAEKHSQAIEDCKYQNGSLVSIHSQDLQDFLTINIGIENKDFWIGMRAKSRQSDHSWIDGTSVDYTNWARGEPTHAAYRTWKSVFEDCVFIYSRNNQAGQWNDEPCRNKKRYICQAKPGNYEDSNTEVECEIKGFIPYRKACYKFELEPKSFHEAENRCQQFGPKAHLVSITDSYEQHAINLHFHKQAERSWIGLSDTNKKYVNLLRWTDTWPVYFSNLKTNDLGIRGTGNGRCVAQKTEASWDVRSWEVISCNSLLPFICKITNEVPPVEETNLSYCPSNKPYWLDLGASHCYYVSNERAPNWSSAQMACNKLDETANLVTFHSKHEEEQLRPLIRKLGWALWIGLRSIKGVYQWADNSNSTYRDWMPEEPEEHANVDARCVLLHFGHLQWSVNDCQENGRFYICALPKASKPEITDTTPTVQVQSNKTAEITETNSTIESTRKSTETSSSVQLTGKTTETNSSVQCTGKTTETDYTVQSIVATTETNPSVKATGNITETNSSLQSTGKSTETNSPLQSTGDSNKTEKMFASWSSLHEEDDFSGKNSVSAGVIVTVVVVVVFSVFSAVGAVYYFWNRRRQITSNDSMFYENLINDNNDL